MMQWLLFLLCLSPFLGAAEYRPSSPNLSQIRVIPVSPTPEGENVETVITFPKENQTLMRQPVELQLRLTGYPIGNHSDFDRRREIAGDPQGQSMRIIIDEYPYISIYRSFIDSLDDNNIFYDQTLNKQIPFDLPSGMHVIRAFPVRSYGESLKGSGTFNASIFYIGGDGGNTFDFSLKKPYLTYNMPQGDIRYNANQPVLLDFYITNARLSRDGYKVQVTINGQVIRVMTAWVPHYIYGLTQGTHKVRLELLDPQNQKVPGSFNDVEKEFNLY